MNKVYLTQEPKVWLVYMKRVDEQKNTKCDLKKVRKSVCRQKYVCMHVCKYACIYVCTVYKRVDVYIG